MLMLMLMLVIADTRPCPGAPGGRALPTDTRPCPGYRIGVLHSRNSSRVVAGLCFRFGTIRNCFSS